MKVKIARNGKVLGEHSVAALRIHLRDRSVLPTDYYWIPGMSGWELVSSRNSWDDASPAPQPPRLNSQSELPAEPTGPKISMQGRVLDFNFSEARGLISADNGMRYNFSASEWRSRNVKIVTDLRVEFVVSGTNAVEIFAVKKGVQKEVPNSVSIKQERKSRGVFVVLALLLGGLGAHNFYAGYVKKGKWTLGMGLIGLVVIIPLVVTTIMALVDIFTVTEDAHGVPFD